ncbi:YfbM family protein [Synechococcus elongatus]|uniref:YfbM family protein n=1 Tax=Synechococcus elongatus PCC 11802 TaxID=2283154 RepID=A0AAT9JTC5_SYNEL|nr:YfbM family protein [Synechococcus elongatus]QFZ92016.1 DUF1877 family protein [Synechococcus elongatus PCC 11802]
MSMIGNFLQVSPEQLAALIADPSCIESFIYREDEDEEEDTSLEIDKAWHGIHYLLTGSAWEGEAPLADAVLGGTEIGDDFGYEPARYLTVEEVKVVAAALHEITPEQFRLRYSADQLSQNEIYPDIWNDSDGDPIEYLVAWYEDLRSYYIEAAANNNAMLKYLN